MSGILGLLGVVLGFTLAVGYQELKDWRRRKRLKDQLLQELRSNLYQLPQIRDTINSVIRNLQNERVLPAESVPFCKVVYCNYYPEVVSSLSMLERNALHVIYSYFEVVDCTLSSFETNVLQWLELHSWAKAKEINLSKMLDLGSLLTDLEDLIRHYLEGKPTDVFKTALEYEEVKKLKFTKNVRPRSGPS